jgi:peroxiredoxin
MLKHQGLQEGGVAPDFTLPAVDGSILSLYDGLQRSSRILLVFLRHLG